MRSYVQDGKTVPVVHTADLVVDQAVLIGTLFGLPVASAKAGNECQLLVEGVVTYARVTGASTGWTLGQAIYWDNTAKKMTGTSSGNTKVGVALAVTGDSDLTGTVRLNGSF